MNLSLRALSNLLRALSKVNASANHSTLEPLRPTGFIAWHPDKTQLHWSAERPVCACPCCAAAEAAKRRVLELEAENTRQRVALKARSDEAATAQRRLRELASRVSVGAKRRMHASGDWHALSSCSSVVRGPEALACPLLWPVAPVCWCMPAECWLCAVVTVLPRVPRAIGVTGSQPPCPVSAWHTQGLCFQGPATQHVPTQLLCQHLPQDPFPHLPSRLPWPHAHHCIALTTVNRAVPAKCWWLRSPPPATQAHRNIRNQRLQQPSEAAGLPWFE